MIELIGIWLVATFAIMITAFLIPGATISSFFSALIAALVLGFINAIIRPLLLFFTLPINILTFGLFTFVINALMIMLAGAIVPGFKIEGFWWALLFSLVLTVINYLLDKIFFS